MDASPVEVPKGEGNACISVSTTFFPGANIDSIPVDLIIVSSDAVFFYVHSQRLIAASDNNFNGHLPMKGDSGEMSDAVISLPQTSSVINILLHTVYSMTCAHYMPSLVDLSAAIEAFKVYGLPTKTYFATGSPLASLLLNYAPTHAIEVYTIAAQHNLQDIAIAASPHLLSFQLSTLHDEIVERMGPVYLKKLFFLHLGRNDAVSAVIYSNNTRAKREMNQFKRIIAEVPVPHPPTPTCDFTDQKAITRAWSLASAYLTWDTRPDMSSSAIERILLPLTEHLTCELCRRTMTDRIHEVVVAWTMVKVCLSFLS